MIYSILIYEAPGMADARPGEEEEKVLEAHRALQQDTKQSGVYIGATQLSEAGAMTVRYREGDSIVTDGPTRNPSPKKARFWAHLSICPRIRVSVSRQTPAQTCILSGW